MSILPPPTAAITRRGNTAAVMQDWQLHIKKVDSYGGDPSKQLTLRLVLVDPATGQSRAAAPPWIGKRSPHQLIPRASRERPARRGPVFGISNERIMSVSTAPGKTPGPRCRACRGRRATIVSATHPAPRFRPHCIMPPEPAMMASETKWTCDERHLSLERGERVVRFRVRRSCIKGIRRSPRAACPESAIVATARRC